MKEELLKEQKEELSERAGEAETAAETPAEQPDPALQSDHYVERPRSQRILAWVLFGLVALGVILYCMWLAGVLK